MEIEPETFTVDTFCEAHNISRAQFYRLRRERKGPRIMKLGRRTLVTKESAAAWRRQVEAETEAAAG